MKPVLAVLLPLVLLTAGSSAIASEGLSTASLAAATRSVKPMAPWIKVEIIKVSTEDRLAWVARSSGGQVYGCVAADSAAVLANQVACARLGTALRPGRAHAETNAAIAQRKRMTVEVLAGDQIAGAGSYYSTVRLTPTP